MKVAEYRELIHAIHYWCDSMQSAATPQERFNEARLVQKIFQELEQAKCVTAKNRDLEMAAIAMNRAKALLGAYEGGAL